jgi:hypothetical protein
MSETVRIELDVHDDIVGSTSYTVAVTIVNAGSAELQGVDVQPVVLPGRLLITQVEVRDTEESELETRRRALIKELENQVTRAYERQVHRSLSALEALAVFVIKIVDSYAFMFSSRPVSSLVPTWTTQAFRINEWRDVETLEREIISGEKEDSRLRKAFLIDKGKLERCLELLAEKRLSKGESFEAGASLAPGSSITFPFTIKAPHLFRRRNTDIRFKLAYRDAESNKVTSRSVGRELTIFPSAFAVPTGGLLGAACGYGIKTSLQSSGNINSSVDPWVATGSVLLGLIIALLTSRKPDTYKTITVEDFLGGFLVGALTGLFSEAFLERLKILVVGSSANPGGTADS